MGGGGGGGAAAAAAGRRWGGVLLDSHALCFNMSMFQLGFWFVYVYMKEY